MSIPGGRVFSLCSARISAGFLAIVLCLLFFTGCGMKSLWDAVKEVRREVKDKLADEGFSVDDFPDVRISLLEWKLEEKWQVASAVFDEGGDPLECGGTCWLFFVDFHPKAYFAHKTAIVLYELEGGKAEVRMGQWWPALSARPLQGQDRTWFTVFNTDEWLNGKQHLVYPFHWGMIGRKLPEVTIDWVPKSEAHFVAAPLESPPEPPSPEDRRKVWALLVQGYGDSSNSFADDVARGSEVMKGLRVPRGNIAVVGRGQSSGPFVGSDCVGGVRRQMGSLLSKINGAGDGGDNKCEEFILYFTSHGWKEELLCRHDVNQTAEFFTSGDLGDMLQSVDGVEYKIPQVGNAAQDTVTPGVMCDRVTIIIQACESGSFTDAVKNSFRDGKEYLLLTSSEAGQLSWKDIDRDDLNPGDVGAEYSSGLWEAFGRGTADGITGETRDHRILGSEAAEYAEKRDAGVLLEISTPQKFTGGDVDLDDLFAGGTPAMPAEMNASIDLDNPRVSNDEQMTDTVVAGQENFFSVEVKHAPGPDISVATVRLLREVDSEEPMEPNEAAVVGETWREIGRTDLKSRLEGGNTTKGSILWKPKRRHLPGDEIELKFSVDAPELEQPKEMTKTFATDPGETPPDCSTIVLIVIGVILIVILLVLAIRWLRNR